MTHTVYRRGQPVMMLAVVLTVWVGARAVMWDHTPKSGMELPGVMAAPVRIALLPVALLPDSTAEIPATEITAVHVPRSHSQQRPHHSPSFFAGDMPWPEHGAWSSLKAAPMAAVSAPPPVPYVSPDARPRGRRWSADGWLLVRDGGASSPITGPARATYGASQLGAVVRYRLAPESGHRPTAYLRGTAALLRPYDREVATGVSARPIASVPLTLAAELRAGEINSTTRVRPAIMAVTELPPQKLPLNLLGEAYAQAGYVGGTGATAFIDGQLRIDAAIARTGRAELRVGGGAWGGAQTGASRFDLGPAMSLGLSVNDRLFARVMLDWRLRVAGNAVPESGPALTLSAGF